MLVGEKTVKQTHKDETDLRSVSPGPQEAAAHFSAEAYVLVKLQTRRTRRTKRTRRTDLRNVSPGPQEAAHFSAAACVFAKIENKNNMG